MSSFNKSKNSNGGQRKRGNFDSVPADDGFRNYMSRKIELQRKQFGLIVPPPPPSPGPTPPTPSPPKILKKARLAKRSNERCKKIVPIPQFADVNNSPSDNTNTNTIRSEKKSVRFHHNLEIEGETKSVSHVLANLKQKQSSLRKKASRLSAVNKRRRKLQRLTSDANGDSNHRTGNNDRNHSCTSVGGVLNNLQKRYGSSASKRRRSPSVSHSSRKRRDDQSGEFPARSTLESLESVEEVGSVLASSSPSSISKVNHADDGGNNTSSKRKRESLRCKGTSILEGLESTINDNAWLREESRESDTLGQQLMNEQLYHVSKKSLPKSDELVAYSPPTGHWYDASPSALSEKLEHYGSNSPLELDESDSLTSTTRAIQIATPSSYVVDTASRSSRKANHRPDLFLTGVVILVNGHTSPDATTLMRLLHKHGGDLEKYETRRVTHIIAEQLSVAKANIYKRQKKPTPVCRPEWITDCVERAALLPFGDYLLEDVRDTDAIGTKTVKSFFNTKPMSKDARLVARDGNASPEESLYKDKVEMEKKRSSNESSTNDSSAHRWQDTHPSKAKYHLNGQVRHTGNDPNFLESYFSNSRLSYIGSFKQRVKPVKIAVSHPRSKAGATKFVLLVDMDCFFASVALRKYPQYRDKPVAVGHCHVARSGADENVSAAKTTYSKNSSSELSTCNYVARKYGVRKGMFLGDAIQVCPDLVVLPYDFEGFQEVTGIVADQLHGYAGQYNGCVEQVSCDESYVEINIFPDDCPHNDTYGFVNTLAEHIRADILKKTECTASIGIGPNKLLAKLAADKVKPNACCVVKDWREFLVKLSLRDIPGIGRKAEKKLQPHGLCTVRDIWDLEDDAKNVLGKIIGQGNAHKIVQYCYGKDERAVTPAIRKSIGAECNYGVRFDGPYGVNYLMQGLAKEVENRMARAGVRGSKLVLKVMKSRDPTKVPGKFLGHGSCDSLSRSVEIPLSRDRDLISSSAMKLFDRLGVDKSLVRGVGIVMNSLTYDDEAGSLNLGPSKLSAWLKKNDNTQANSRNHEEKAGDGDSSLQEEADASELINESFSIEEDHEATALETSESSSSMMTTLSQLDQDVLQNLPEEILNEVFSMYGKSSSQQSRGASQSSPKPSKRNITGKGKKSDKPIPIAGQTSVRRMLKLACIKSGDEQLDGNNLRLSQLDCLPMEVQLQIANGDDVEIIKGPKHTATSRNDSNFLTVDPDNPEGVDLLADPDSQFENPRSASPEYSASISFEEDITPLQDFIAANPTPDFETIGTVKDFLLLCIHEKRIDDTVVFLRTIKNMQHGWGNTIYAQLRESTATEIYSRTGSLLDMRWLGL